MVPKSAIAATVAAELGWPLLQAEAAVDRWADSHGVHWAAGWQGNPSMSEGSAEACLAELRAAQAADARALRIAQIIDAQESSKLYRISGRERIELLGGPEHASKLAANHSIPLDPVKVITQAELDAQREALKAQRIPGVAYREPIDRPIPVESPPLRMISKTVREWMAEDRLSAWES